MQWKEWHDWRGGMHGVGIFRNLCSWRLANHTGVSLWFTTERSLNKSCDIPILEAAVRQVTPKPLNIVQPALHALHYPLVSASIHKLFKSINLLVVYLHVLLYHFIQFGRARGAWQPCRNFGFDNLPKSPWQAQILGNFRQLSATGDEFFYKFVTWSPNKFGTQQKLPWLPWHFGILEDCRIEWNGTVLEYTTHEIPSVRLLVVLVRLASVYMGMQQFIMFEVIGLHSKCGVVFWNNGLAVRTMGWVGNGRLAFKVVGLGSKWWACVQSSGVELETEDSHSKQWGQAGNGGLAFKAVGVCSKWRARIWVGSKRRAHFWSSGVGFETAGSCFKQCGWIWNGGLKFKAVQSGWKRWAHVPRSGVGLETVGLCSK